jgi:4-aminobutyrate aminotransferase
VFFLNSGSEAVEASVRLARQATGRPLVVAFDGGFHGRTMGAAALTTSGSKIRAGIGPLMGGVAFAPFPYAFRYGWSEEETVAFCLRELDRLLITAAPAADVAAFLIEPVLGEGGYVPAPPAFLAGLRERADAHGILLIADEVQTGFGRTGKFWGHEHTDGLTPDVLITAKGLASGFPLSGIAASEELMAKAWPGSQGGTYGGNAVACAAALATLDVIEEESLVANAAEQGLRLRDGLHKVAADHAAIADVRGLGLMVGNEFCTADGAPDTAAATRAHAAAAEKGLLLLTCGPHGNVVRMIPPLIVTAEQVDDAVAIWAEAVRA